MWAPPLVRPAVLSIFEIELATFWTIHLQILESPEETKSPRSRAMRSNNLRHTLHVYVDSYAACRGSGLTLVAEGTPGAGRGAQDTEDPVEQWTEARLSVRGRRRVC